MKSNKLFLFALLLLFTINSHASPLIGPTPCNKLKPCNTKPPRPFPGDVNFKIVSSGLQTGINNQQLQVIRNKADFFSLLQQTNMPISKILPDFTKLEYIAIFAGSNDGCGHSVSVNTVINRADSVVVYTTKSIPRKGRYCPLYVPASKPYVVISIARSNKPISLISKIIRY